VAGNIFAADSLIAKTGIAKEQTHL